MWQSPGDVSVGRAQHASLTAKSEPWKPCNSEPTNRIHQVLLWLPHVCPTLKKGSSLEIKQKTNTRKAAAERDGAGL